MYSFEPKELSHTKVHAFMVGGIAPRPIALVSTISFDGIPNLSPFSFFNAFGSNPPVVAFSASRRGKDGTLKDTFNNLVNSKECVINIVTEPILEQINLTSTEYQSNTNEWELSALTPIQSENVKPPRVRQSQFQMECILLEMVSIGENPGSANIAICEVIRFHIDEQIMEDGRLNLKKIHHIGRNGGNLWTNVDERALFQLIKPLTKNNIGITGLPDYIRNSQVFTNNDLARFGLLEFLPDRNETLDFINQIEPLKSSLFDFRNYQISANLTQLLASALYNINNDFYIMDITAKEFLHHNLLSEAFHIASYQNILKEQLSINYK